MVNIDTKKAIHNALLQSEGWISGELISSHLCISRVAVWKHLQKMKEAGYPLLSSGSGYKLSPDEDTLAPWALDLHGREGSPFRPNRIHHGRGPPTGRRGGFTGNTNPRRNPDRGPGPVRKKMGIIPRRPLFNLL